MIKDIAFTAYPAADVPKLVSFYKDSLGIAFGEPLVMDGQAGYAEAPVGAGYFAVMLPEWIDRPKGSGAGVAFEVDDLAATLAKLTSAGVKCGETMMFPACKLANFDDPEGNKVTLHETTTPH